MPGLGDPARAPRGKRPMPHGDDRVDDRLIAMLMALTGEVAALRQRLDVVERVADAAGAFRRADVEAFMPDPAAAADQEMQRRRLLETVFFWVTKELRDLDEGATSDSYGEAIRSVADG